MKILVRSFLAFKQSTYFKSFLTKQEEAEDMKNNLQMGKNLMKADGSSIRLFLHNHHFKSLRRNQISSKSGESLKI